MMNSINNNIDDEEEEILYLSSGGSSDDVNNEKHEKHEKQEKEEKDEIKNDKIISFASLPSDGNLYHKKQGQDEQQSDVLDSLQLLSISFENEIELIQHYFPEIVINFINNDLIFNHESSAISHDYKNIEFIINSNESQEEIAPNPIELIIKCLNNYPFDEYSCHCRVLNCPLLSNQENMILKDKINWIAQQHTKQQHNCIIMILIYLETRLSSLNNKKSMIMNMIQSPEYDISNINSNNNSNNNSNSNSISNIAENGFFDSLKSLHQNHIDDNNNNNNNNNNILPSSFTNLQDIFTTKTRREKKAEQEYALIDDKLICPKMCGAVWGRNGQLIFFNNILIKRAKNSKAVKIEEERNELKSFEDYNKFIAKRGANHIHSDELHSIRKRVFANHMDDDEDRFADEFLVGFSLSKNETHPNQTKSKYYPYKNAYLHRSVSFLHQQHHQQQHRHYHHHHHNHHHLHHQHQYHKYLKDRNNDIMLRMHQHRGTQHHIMPHLVLPSSHHINAKNDKNDKKIRKKRDKYGPNKHHKMAISSLPTLPSVAKEGNARIFCPGIIRFIINCNFSMELAKKCKLRADKKYNVSQLCLYNAILCKSLRLNRLSKILKTLSTFLETACCSNTLIPSPYHGNYIAKFVEKAIDELYINNEIQGIAIIACLLRQSQYFVILFFESNNTGFLLQRCCAQYLRIIKKYRKYGKYDRNNISNISDIEQLEKFEYLLNKQKSMLYNK